jgi:3-oxoacyl-[acyl-carrier protein] reductase
MSELLDKRVLVTGATGEIGAAISRQLYKSGCKVCLAATRENVLKTLTSELGERAQYICSDLMDIKNAKVLIDKATAQMGGVDILINNAGITRDNLLMRMSDDEWADVMNVNLNSSMILARGAIKQMIKSRWGRVVNITSVVGVIGNPGQANYAASKSGLIGMSKSIASEVASRGITVNCIAPGFITSDMTDKLNSDQKTRILENIPMKRMGEANDIAAATGFLVSQGANYVTGQTIHVNGGMAMI